MINLSDRLTAKTVENILGDSKEIAYIQYEENMNQNVSGQTVAHSLNVLNDQIVTKVTLGDEVGDISHTWEQGTVEQYVDSRVSELNASLDRKIAAQQMMLNTMNGNEVVVYGTLPSKGEIGLIYRVYGENSYSDYMWDIMKATPAFTKLATYTYPGLDARPTPGSEKLVKSGGIFSEIVHVGVAFNITEYNSGATYSDLTQALAQVPLEYQREGISVRFIQEPEGKYTEYFNTYSAWTTDVSEWMLRGGIEQELGNSTIVTVSQKKITDEVNQLNMKIDVVKSSTSVTLEPSMGTVYKNVSTNITLTAKMENYSPDTLAIYQGNTLVASGTTTPVTANTQVNLSSDRTYKVVGEVHGLTYSGTTTVHARYPIYYGFGATMSDVAVDAKRYSPTTTSAMKYEAKATANNQYFFILVPQELPALKSFTMGGAPFAMNSGTDTIGGVAYYKYSSANKYNNGTQVSVTASN